MKQEILMGLAQDLIQTADIIKDQPYHLDEGLTMEERVESVSDDARDAALVFVSSFYKLTENYSIEELEEAGVKNVVDTARKIWFSVGDAIRVMAGYPERFDGTDL